MGLVALDVLLERLRAATGPDRELDLALTNAFDLPDDGLVYRWGMQALDPGSKVVAVLEPTGDEADNPHFQQYVRDRYQGRSLITPRSYTASIDSALALVERKGWRLYTVDASIAGRFNVLLAGPKRARWSDELGVEVTIPDYASAAHDIFCVAILISLLTALALPIGDENG